MVRNPSSIIWFALVSCLALLVVFVDVLRSTWFLFLVALLLSLFIGLAIIAPEMVWKARMLWSGTFGIERRLDVARSRSKVSPLLEDAIRRSDEASCRGAIDYCIGDAHAPGLIVHAVYAGHRYAREFDDSRSHEERVDGVPFRRQRPVL